MTTTLEIERKLEAPDDVEVPDLAGAGGGVRVVERGRVELEATYFDTADLALASAGISVRRRVGGDDEGWHLKLPTGKDRYEVALPLSRTKHIVPKELRDALRAVVGDQELRPCCVVSTARRRYEVVDGDGTVLAEVADDEVRGQRRDPQTEEPEGSTWREWEVELRDGDGALLEDLVERLTAAGGTASSWGSKLARTLRVAVPRGPAAPSKLPKKASAAAVLEVRIDWLWQQFRLRDVAVRRDLPDAVHQLRVTVRRLRSLLATYRPLLDRDVTEPLRDELKWLGDLLGEPRDAEVVRDLVLQAQGSLPPELVRGDLGRGVGEAFTSEYAAGYEPLAEAMETERYWRLDAALERLATSPPWRGKAAKRATRVLPKRVDHEWRRVRKRMARVHATDRADEEAYAARLHEARKAAKRLRYAAEAAEPVAGKDARRLAKQAKRFTSYVGEYNDTGVVRDRLLHLADHASPGPGEAFTLGALYGRVQRHGDELVKDVPERWRRLRRPKLRRWLD